MPLLEKKCLPKQLNISHNILVHLAELVEIKCKSINQNKLNKHVNELTLNSINYYDNYRFFLL